MNVNEHIWFRPRGGWWPKTTEARHRKNHGINEAGWVKLQLWVFMDYTKGLWAMHMDSPVVLNEIRFSDPLKEAE